MELETYTTIPVDECRVDNRLTVLRRRAVAVGIDIGQAHDPTAIAIVSKLTTTAAEPSLEHVNPDKRPRYEVHHLERLPLGMSYPSQVDRLDTLLCRPPLNRMGPRVLVYYTGVEIGIAHG